MRSSCPTRCCARSAVTSTAARRAAPTSRTRIAERPRAGARGAPRRVRRAARRGAPHVPPARRARRVQRHLGVGPHAPRRAGGRAAGVAARGRDRRTGAHRRREHRRDVRAGRAARAARRPTSSRARRDRPRHPRPKDAPPFLGDPPQPPPDPSGLPPGIGRIMRATGIALDSLFGSSEAEHEHDMLRGLAASPGVYEGPARLIAGPVGVRPHRAGRRAAHAGHHRGVQHPAAAARRHRDRQRRAAVTLGDRRPRVRHPRRGRHARSDPAHRRRHARARRRRRRRSDGARR